MRDRLGSARKQEGGGYDQINKQTNAQTNKLTNKSAVCSFGGPLFSRTRLNRTAKGIFKETRSNENQLSGRSNRISREFRF